MASMFVGDRRDARFLIANFENLKRRFTFKELTEISGIRYGTLITWMTMKRYPKRPTKILKVFWDSLGYSLEQVYSEVLNFDHLGHLGRTLVLPYSEDLSSDGVKSIKEIGMSDDVIRVDLMKARSVIVEDRKKIKNLKRQKKLYEQMLELLKFTTEGVKDVDTFIQMEDKVKALQDPKIQESLGEVKTLVELCGSAENFQKLYNHLLEK